jgi:RNA polymerase sigma-70 factor (sigma-E family)
MAGRGQRGAAAFSDFVAARSTSLFRTAYRMMGDYQLAQDLMQESLVKAYVAWPRLRDVTKAEAYTRRIIVTTSISWRRRRAFHEYPTASRLDSASPDQTEQLGAQEELWTQLLLLPPRQRAAVVLRFCEDMSEAQTAELMGCSVGSVKRQVSLGLTKVRDRLGPRLTLPTSASSDESPVISVAVSKAVAATRSLSPDWSSIGINCEPLTRKTWPMPSVGLPACQVSPTTSPLGWLRMSSAYACHVTRRCRPLVRSRTTIGPGAPQALSVVM